MCRKGNGLCRAQPVTFLSSIEYSMEILRLYTCGYRYYTRKFRAKCGIEHLACGSKNIRDANAHDKVCSAAGKTYPKIADTPLRRNHDMVGII